MAAKSKPENIEPNPTQIAVYVPHATLNARRYLEASNTWLEPGKVFSSVLERVGKQYFPNLRMVPHIGHAQYGLLVDLDPEWSRDSGKLELTMAYAVYGADGTKLLEGSAKPETARLSNFNAVLENTTVLAVRQVMNQIQGRLNPNAAQLAMASTAAINYAPLVNRKRPVRTGTGFFINRTGQLLTAAHITHECMLLEAQQESTIFPVTVGKASALLDVAVLDSARSRDSALPLRRGHGLTLGEPITAIGYPAIGHAGDAVNVARGNISASKGPRGSLGMFQFSAPAQSGNGGSPVVSDDGELLGIAVGTLDNAKLASNGRMPQNADLALDARHLALFLQREHVAFDTINPAGNGSLQTAAQAVLPNTVQINCYQ